jgi:hypothetical protein
MKCDRRTVAACVFQGHEAPAHGRHECPLVQVLMRRVRNLGIDEVPAYVDRELDKYRSVARVLDCPLLAKVTLQELSPRFFPLHAELAAVTHHENCHYTVATRPGQSFLRPFGTNPRGILSGAYLRDASDQRIRNALG